MEKAQGTQPTTPVLCDTTVLELPKMRSESLSFVNEDEHTGSIEVDASFMFFHKINCLSLSLSFSNPIQP